MISVLLVDDVEINIDVLEVALEDKYKVYKALNGVEALELLNEHKDIKAVITDIQMRKMTGLQLIRTIRRDENFNDLVILVNTAFGDLQTETEIRTMGVDGFIYKPSEPNEVAERLANAIENH